MKAQTFSSFIALAAGLQQVTATGWNDFPSFKCPKNSCDKCTSHQSSGFDWSDLGFGSFSSYGGFDFSGFTCGNSVFKRDGLTGRTFNDKCIQGSASSEPHKCPQLSCSDVDSFSIDVLEVSVEFDCDLEFHYGMGDGSTCKQKSSCSKSGTSVKNSQCGGAKNVTVVLPSPPPSKPTCSVGIHSIGFNCPSSCTTTASATSTPESITTTSTAAGTTTTSEALTTSESSSSVYTTATSTSTSTTAAETSSAAASSTSTSVYETETTTSSAEESTSTSSVEVTTSTLSAKGTTSTSGSEETSSTSSAEETTSTSSNTETTSIYVSETSSVAYSTSSEETSAAGTTTSAAETITTVIVETTVTTCPVTNTYTSGGTTSTEVIQTVSTITTTRTSTVCDKCKHTATSATEVAPVSSVSPPQPTSDCPSVLPSCLKTWLTLETNCQGNDDYACFCPNSNLTKLVFECLSAHGASDSEVSAAQSYFQGICAEFVPQNPGLITAAPTLTATAVVTGPVTTIAVYTTVVVPCTESNGPASTTTVISSAVTVPQVVFTTVTGTGVGLVPGTAAAAVTTAAAATTVAAATAAATPAPTYVQTTLATVAPTFVASNGTGTGIASPAQFTGAASKSGVTFSVVGAAALALSFFAM